MFKKNKSLRFQFLILDLTFPVQKAKNHADTNAHSQVLAEHPKVLWESKSEEPCTESSEPIPTGLCKSSGEVQLILGILSRRRWDTEARQDGPSPNGPTRK